MNCHTHFIEGKLTELWLKMMDQFPRTAEYSTEWRGETGSERITKVINVKDANIQYAAHNLLKGSLAKLGTAYHITIEYRVVKIFTVELKIYISWRK